MFNRPSPAPLFAPIRSNFTTSTVIPPRSSIDAYYDHSSAQRVDTSTVMAQALQKEYPKMRLLVVPEPTCDLLEYADKTGGARYERLPSKPSSSHGHLPLSGYSITTFTPGPHRTDRGRLADKVIIEAFTYLWKSIEYIVYVAEGRDGTSSYPQLRMCYILHDDKGQAENLAFEVGQWTTTLHEEIWMFDEGYWQKSAELFESIKSASWDQVILDDGMKKMIIDDHLSFFSSRDRYIEYKVPWKRGVIYYGPPGNGKTISIKAMMNALYHLKDPIPTLYVRSLASGAGPEYSIKQIFSLARQMAPCYLIFEDLDSIVTDSIRSYFLNEVDGLKANDGIFMLGSTNHLDRLDPGISKRPSRFDRKYLFPDPNQEQRIAYCHFWQRKLQSNRDIAFPDSLCPAIAGITDKFSFAYMQEAFVASLLAIARESSLHTEPEMEWIDLEGDNDDNDGDLNKYILWREMQKQVKTLRDAL